LEANAPGFGASSRKGGDCGTLPFKLSFDATEGLLGRDRAIAVWREGPASVAYVEDLIQKEQIVCDFTRSGRFTGAHRPSAYEAQARTADMLRRKLGLESH